MREIKFRVFDTELNKMIYEENKIEIFDDMIGFRFQEHFEADIPIVMQYTGLKDMNGKEIYDGDIVKGHWWKKGNTHRHIGRVTYVMNAFKVRGVKQYLGMDDELNPTYEVIGNIYENPELLEESK